MLCLKMASANRPETPEKCLSFAFAMKSMDWLAVDAVQGEPGSAPSSLFIRELTGNFLRLTSFLVKPRACDVVDSIVSAVVPCKI
jgi:hypothetical protein